MNAMPSLTGSVGYIFTSCALDIKTSENARFKEMVEHFKVYDHPRRPEGKDEEWLAGERVDTRGTRLGSDIRTRTDRLEDYLLYGRFYIPTGRLDALYSTRLSPTLQAVVAAISDSPTASSTSILRQKGASNVMFNLQHDVGKWCTEYSYSAEDGMWGVKFLHNFGKLGLSTVEQAEDVKFEKGMKRIDEEEPVEGGLKGRLSAGAEFYFSLKERSAGGLSIGCFHCLYVDSFPSFNWNTVFDTPQCNSPVFPNHITVLTSQYGISNPSSFTASYDYNRSI